MRPRRRRYLKGLHRAGLRLSEQDAPSAPRVLVVAHVFYPELWEELLGCIERIPGQPDVAVTVVKGFSDQLVGTIAAQCPQAHVRIVPNRGRDILPLLEIVDLVPRYDIVLKIHTKRSTHRASGDAWRRSLLADLCGSTEQIKRCQAALGNPRVGIVAPSGSVLGREFFGPNRDWLRELSGRSPIPVDTTRVWFPAGSIYWTKPSVLLALASLGLSSGDFEVEDGAVDGTLAHALERFVGVEACLLELAVLEVGDLDTLISA